MLSLGDSAAAFTINTETEENPEPFGSSPENAVYYHWDFTDSGSYKKGLTDGTVNTQKPLTITTAPDSEAYGLLKYSSNTNTSLSYSSASGIIRNAVTNDYFTIFNKDGGEGIALTKTNGFMMEITGTIENSTGIFLGAQRGTAAAHPYFFKQDSKQFYIGGATPTAKISLEGIDTYKSATYRFGFDGTNYTFEIIQGETHLEFTPTFNGDVAESFFNWVYLMPKFGNNSGYNFKGSISDLKFWTSYNYPFSIEGSNPATYTIEGLPAVVTAADTEFKVTPKGNYILKSVSLNGTELIPNDDGYYMLCLRDASVLRIITEANVGGHRVDEGIITRSPSCTEDGLKLYTCLDCAETFEELIPAFGHDMDTVGVITKVPTKYSAGERTFACQNEGCGEYYIEYISALEALYYHWDFTDTSAYKAGGALSIKTAPDSQAVSEMVYVSGAENELVYNESGLSRENESANYFTIKNKNGSDGIILSLTDGFMLEFTASFSANSDIILGRLNAGWGHPFIFRSAADKLTIGGSVSSAALTIPKATINMSELATYLIIFDGTSYHLKVTQGENVFNSDFIPSPAPAEEFYTFNYMFPNFREGFNFKGSVTDLKFWTSYSFDVTAKGENFTTDLSDSIFADSSKTFRITPADGYELTEVTASSGLLTSNPDGTYTLSYPTSDCVIKITTHKPTVLGDANGDGKVDLIDLVRTRKHMVNNNTVIDSAADINRDGTIDALDLAAIINKILGIDK